MGKGDQRSRRGKIWRGTFGRRRPKKHHGAAKIAGNPTEPVTTKTSKKQSEASA